MSNRYLKPTGPVLALEVPVSTAHVTVATAAHFFAFPSLKPLFFLISLPPSPSPPPWPLLFSSPAYDFLLLLGRAKTPPPPGPTFLLTGCPQPGKAEQSGAACPPRSLAHM